MADSSLESDERDNLDGSLDDSNGLGNLADELAEAWDDGGLHSQENESTVEQNGDSGFPNGHNDLSNGSPGIPHREVNDSRSLSPPKRSLRLRHPKKSSNVSDYDGSDYGDASDLETVEGISASLEHRLAAIESLARRGTESNGSEGDGLLSRVAESLRDLSSQTPVETGASRYGTWLFAAVCAEHHRADSLQLVQP